MKKRSAVVIGIGDYAKKLLKPLQRFFDIVALIDVSSEPKAHLPAWARTRFMTSVDFAKDVRPFHAADVAFLFTPHHTHAQLAIPFLERRQPIVVEKPLVTRLEDLEALQPFAEGGAPLYCSDFYVDVRAAALLFAAGKIDANSWLARKISPRRGLWDSLRGLDPISLIESRLHETYPVRRGTWLDQRESGGVIFDMLPHSLALLKRLLPEEDLHIERCMRKFRPLGAPAGTFIEQPPDPETAEAFVRVEGRTSSGVPVRLEASKEASSQDRVFEIRTRQAWIVQEFGPHALVAIARDGRRVTSRLTGDRYWLMARAVSSWLDCGAPTYGWEWTSWTVRKLLEIRNWSDPRGTEEVPDEVRGSQKPQSSAPTRRDVGKWVAGGIGITFVSGWVTNLLSVVADVVTVGNEVAGRVTETAKRAAEETEEVLTNERKLLLSSLVAPTGSLTFRTGKEHPNAPRGSGPFPHDMKAVAPFQYLAAGRVEVVESGGIAAQMEAGDLLVATGSPTSSSLARELMASPRRVSNLPYTFRELDESPFVRVYSGMLGREELKKGKQVVNSEGRAIFDDRDNIGAGGWMERDYLVISRLPREGLGQDVLLLSGVHGAGTQAAELLFRPSIFSTDDMRFLLSSIGGRRYWQAVFEVKEIRNKLPMTVGLNLALVRKDAPPVAFSPIYHEGGILV